MTACRRMRLSHRFGIACGYLFSRSYVMVWQEKATSDDPAVESVQAHLLELGFPDDVLADLTDSDILAYFGARDVYTEKYDIAFNPGRIVTIRSWNTVHSTTVYDGHELYQIRRMEWIGIPNQTDTYTKL